jgi:hypothetical protein
LFTGVAHILIIAEFEKTSYLGIGDNWESPESSRSGYVNICVCGPFCDIGKGGGEGL